MKKTIIMTIALTAFAAIAAPRPGPAPHRGPAPRPAPVVSRPAPRSAPRPAPAQHRHHESFWGRGGRNFWPGFIGGAVSTALLSPPPPPVVQHVVIGPVRQPTVTQVWIEGRWIDQIQPNGTIVRIWQPGHYEIIY